MEKEREILTERIDKAVEDMEKVIELYRQRYLEECEPDKDILEVLKQCREQLKEYWDVGPTPNQLREIDKFYSELSKEVSLYRKIGTVEECQIAMKTVERYETQYLDDMKNPLEPLKLKSALDSELFKLEYRKEHKPKEISPLDYTVIYALIDCLKRATGGENGETT